MLVACGGGGSSSGTVPQPGPSTPPPQVTTASAHFVLGGAGATIASRARRPQYVAATTKSITIGYAGASFPDVMNIDPTSSNCSGGTANLVCSIDVTAPIGNDTFIVSAYDQPKGTGNRLSTAQVPVTIVAGANVVHATLQGDVASLSLGTIDVPMGVATSVPVPLIVKDADGNVIVGPGSYNGPIALTNGDTSGTTTLSTTSLSGPAVFATLAYAGHGTPNGKVAASADIAAGSFASTVGSGGGVIRVVAPSREYALPSGNSALGSMVSAPDGSLWFAETRAIAHVTMAGTVTEFPLPSSLNGPTALAFGVDGNLWFDAGYPNAPSGAQQSAVVMLSAAGQFTPYSVPFATAQRQVNGLALGADGALWFAANGQLAKIDRFGTITTIPTPSLPAGGTPEFGAAVAGSDGNVWFAELAQGELLRVTPAGTATYFPMPPMIGGYQDRAGAIVLAPDGRFVVGGTSGTIYRIDMTGAVVATTVGAVEAYGSVAVASDGTVWTALGSDYYGGSIAGHVSPTAIDRVAVVGQGAVYPNDFVALHAGGDGNVWFLRGAHVGTIVLH